MCQNCSHSKLPPAAVAVDTVYNKFMHNLANTGLIIKNCIPMDSIRVILQGRAMIIVWKGQSWVHRHVWAICLSNHVI